MSQTGRRFTAVMLFTSLCCGSAVADLPPGEAERRRTEIENMSAVDREKLWAQYQAFRALSESEQEHYRRLHAGIEQDAQSGGRLREVLENYTSWLSTLSPWQQRQIRETQDPRKKVELVISFKQEQQRKGQEPRRLYPGSFGRGFGRLSGFGPQLGVDDLDAVMKVIEQNTTFTRDQQSDLEQRVGINRHLYVLDKVLRPDRALERPAGSENWPTEELLNKLVAEIRSEGPRRSLEQADSESSRRRQFARLLSTSLMARLEAESRQQIAEDMNLREKLEDLFKNLDDRDRDEIMRMPPEEADRRLAWLYFRRHPEESTIDWERAPRVVFSLMQRSGLWRRGGSTRSPFTGGRDRSFRGPSRSDDSNN